MAERLGVPATACLMIDDQVKHVEGARATGLRAHLYVAGRVDELIVWLEREGALP